MVEEIGSVVGGLLEWFLSEKPKSKIGRFFWWLGWGLVIAFLAAIIYVIIR